MSEVWKACMGNYEISNIGRFRRSTPGRRTFAGRLSSPILMKNGYYSVRPVVDGKNVQFYVHALVAEAFIGPRPDGASVNHIDGDKTNNAAFNLEYVTHAENMHHAATHGLMVRGESHPGSKLTDVSVQMLRADRAGGLSYSKLAAKYGISIYAAFQAANHHSWRHVA